MDVIARDFRDELSTIYTCIHLYPANGNHGGSSRMCGSWMIVMILQSGVSGILIQMRRPVGKQSRRVGRLVVSFFLDTWDVWFGCFLQMEIDIIMKD